MNIFLKQPKNNPKEFKLRNLLSTNYGVSINSINQVILKNKLSKISSNKNYIIVLNKVLNKNSLKFNRFLKLRNYKIIDRIRKQASWKGLRLRQGLPLNGQRTHTNARTAKRLVPSLLSINY